MPRLMWDSTTLADIPAGAEVVATYCDGLYAVPRSEVSKRFPKAALPRINVTGDPAHGGDVLDVETGDATPAHAPAWIRARQAAGERYVTVYCARNTLAAVVAACQGLHYYHWVATLDGKMLIASHPDASVQFAGPDLTGIHADASVVWNDAWHPAP
jgi:hypothetical protein